MAQTHDGAIKVVARKAGVSPEEFEYRVSVGLKWCYACKKWHPKDAFFKDKSRFDGMSAVCSEQKNSRTRDLYTPKPQVKFAGRSFVPARDNDKKQARRRINYFVEAGFIPAPNDLPCTDCGHVWVNGSSRHEYDHYLGYTAEHHEHVEAVCSKCHSSREWKRRGR